MVSDATGSVSNHRATAPEIHLASRIGIAVHRGTRRAAKRICRAVSHPVVTPGRSIGLYEMMAASVVNTDHVLELVTRVRGEYLEMPGLTLTVAQAQRLWGMDATQCSCVLAALVDAGFLHRSERGYMRRSES